MYPSYHNFTASIGPRLGIVFAVRSGRCRHWCCKTTFIPTFSCLVSSHSHSRPLAWFRGMNELWPSRSVSSYSHSGTFTRSEVMDALECGLKLLELSAHSSMVGSYGHRDRNTTRGYLSSSCPRLHPPFSSLPLSLSSPSSPSPSLSSLHSRRLGPSPGSLGL